MLEIEERVFNKIRCNIYFYDFALLVVLVSVQMVVQFHLNFAGYVGFVFVTLSALVDMYISMVELSNVSELSMFTKNHRFVQILEK